MAHTSSAEHAKAVRVSPAAKVFRWFRGVAPPAAALDCPAPPPELEAKLRRHEEWLQSGGEGEPPVDFAGEHLAGLDLRGRNLHRAVFQHAVPVGAPEPPPHSPIFHHASLRRAILTETVGLRRSDLAGADLQDAVLDKPLQSDDAVKAMDEASKNASQLFLSLLLACMFGWLTLGTTKDGDLLTNTGTAKLPVLNIDIPVNAFYVLMPVLLLAFFLYLHLFLQRLWDATALLPAVFPDGESLDVKTHPRLVNHCVAAYFPRLQLRRPPLAGAQQVLTGFLLWAFLPLTLLLFLGRYIPKHDWWGTGFHILVCSACFALSAWLRWLAAASHSGAIAAFRAHAMTLAVRAAGLAVIPGALLWLGARHALSPDPLTGPLARPVTAAINAAVTALGQIGYRESANLAEAMVSQRPGGWDGKNTNQVAGALLADAADLRNAVAHGAFLVRARVRGVNLTGADLTSADLREADFGVTREGALAADRVKKRAAFQSDREGTMEMVNFDWDRYASNLSGATLIYANLTGAKLKYANLERAELMEADLTRASLSEVRLNNANLAFAILASANLTGANLAHAKLTDANLTGADLNFVDLAGANLSRANLTGTKLGANLAGVNLMAANLTRADLTGGERGVGANLAGANLEFAMLPGAKLTGVNLTRANLTSADLAGANLAGAILTEAKLGANLAGVNLMGANLTRADLAGGEPGTSANLVGANLEFANLTDTKLTGVGFSPLTKWPKGFDPLARGAVLLDQASPGSGAGSRAAEPGG